MKEMEVDYMNRVMKKAGMSMLSGASYMLGSWMTKYLLDKSKEKINEHSKEEKKEEGPT